MSGLIIAIFVVVLLIIFFSKALKIVPQSSTLVIERLGKYNRTLESGINLIIPILDKPRVVVWDLPSSSKTDKKRSAWIDLREQVYDYPKQRVITKDNVNVDVDALLYFQIIEPEKAVYEISNLTLAIEMLTQTTLRNVLGALELDELLTSRDIINTQLRDIIDEATDKWGVKVGRVEIKALSLDNQLQEQMEKQMKAERERRATILLAEGEKQAKILEAEGIREAQISKAEGEKQAAILKAQGEAESIEKIKAALGGADDYTKYIIATKYIDALEKMVEGKDNKVVYMPYEATGVLSSLGGIKDMFKES